MAQKIGVDERLMASWVESARTAIMDAWRDQSRHFGFDAKARERVESHWARIPLLQPR
jgi:hypothetical protein